MCKTELLSHYHYYYCYCYSIVSHTNNCEPTSPTPSLWAEAATSAPTTAEVRAGLCTVEGGGLGPSRASGSSCGKSDDYSNNLTPALPRAARPPLPSGACAGRRHRALLPPAEDEQLGRPQGGQHGAQPVTHFPWLLQKQQTKNTANHTVPLRSHPEGGEHVCALPLAPPWLGRMWGTQCRRGHRARCGPSQSGSQTAWSPERPPWDGKMARQLVLEPGCAGGPGLVLTRTPRADGVVFLKCHPPPSHPSAVRALPRQLHDLHEHH